MSATPHITNERPKNPPPLAQQSAPDEILSGPLRVPSRQGNARAATSRGWVSIGKGIAQLAAPRSVARVFGIRDTRATRIAIRVLGAHELVAGVGLASGRRKDLWMHARVTADFLDVALLSLSYLSPSARRGSRVPTSLLTIAGVTALDIIGTRAIEQSDEETRPRAPTADFVTVSASISIDRPAAEIYAFWRDFQNLSRFMSNVESVRILDDVHSRWVVSALGKSIHWDASITEDRSGELIAWRTQQGADIAHEGRVRFTAAPGGRGTDVSVKLRIRPPAWPLGRQLANLATAVPRNEIKSDLRRLKQVIELGAVVRSDASIHVGAHPARPASKSTALKSS